MAQIVSWAAKNARECDKVKLDVLEPLTCVPFTVISHIYPDQTQAPTTIINAGKF